MSKSLKTHDLKWKCPRCGTLNQITYMVCKECMHNKLGEIMGKEEVEGELLWEERSSGSE